MPENKRPVGRPRRYAKFEAFEASLPPLMSKRPLYCEGIGFFRGATSYTAWVKVRLPRGGTYRGRSIPTGGSIEHKLGNRASWDWPQLLAERDRLQGLADRVARRWRSRTFLHSRPMPGSGWSENRTLCAAMG